MVLGTWYTRADQIRELARRFYFLLVADLNNLARDPAAQTLFAKLINQISKMPFAQPVDQFRSRFARHPVKTKINWPIVLVTKPTLFVQQLIT